MSGSTGFAEYAKPLPVANKSGKTYTRAEVAKHNKKGDCWIVVDTAVYDLSKFAGLHPGGEGVLYDATVAGKDATAVFFGLHRAAVLEKYARLIIGQIENEQPQVIVPQRATLSPVPFGEPTWLAKGYYSPYYNDGHRKFQKEMRFFFDTHVKDEAAMHELNDKKPTEALIKRMGTPEWHLNAMRLGPGKHLHGLTLPSGLKGEDFDYFHELIITQEISRIGSRGYSDGLLGGMVIGLPPVMNFGQPAIQKKVIPGVLSGDKYISLAISEAFAGSDVAGLRTTATKSEDGKHWIINGTKKWITNGAFSDFFTVGCKTDKGLTVFLVERDDTVDTKLIKTSYSTAAGTAYITFDNTKVPAENMLGKENDGLRVILSNFNHERWVMCCGAARGARYIVEECFKWAHQRQVFGKALIEQPVIRQKFAHMFALVESGQAWLEQLTYQMNKMNYKQQSDLLAGPIGLLKMRLTRNLHEISDDAVQIFGGRGITKGGMGVHIETFQRTYKFDALLGGAEEVLGDLFVRQAMRKMPKAVL
ncbi:acyl-CoA dehydrogenase NM domain-like protein [Cystobasidium minutum MCA 4210]|uniref:acyl-CoA dehydrogenase NM domain-like protein n=1 Tax=Cystobasidium minutum MCA 4210 TaxID=1397322 RepID=UPI0034CE064F|eukprot:jgi/Rhomi1/63942/CE63941_4441